MGSTTPLNMTGTYIVSPPLFAPSIGRGNANAWTLDIHDFANDAYEGNPVWATFSFGTFKGLMMMDEVSFPSISSSLPPGPPLPPPPPPIPEEDEVEEGEIRESLGSHRSAIPPSSSNNSTPQRTIYYPFWNHVWRPGQRIHFRWRGSDGPVNPTTYSVEDIPPRTIYRVDIPVLPSVPVAMVPGVFNNARMEAESSVPRTASWAGSGEMIFQGDGGFELDFCCQGQIWQLDGVKVGDESAEGLKPWSVVDGYGRGWYELFWLADRQGDWEGDADAELVEGTT